MSVLELHKAFLKAKSIKLSKELNDVSEEINNISNQVKDMVKLNFGSGSSLDVGSINVYMPPAGHNRNVFNNSHLNWQDSLRRRW